MVVSPRLPGLLQTLETHPSVDIASDRPTIEDCLHSDALQAIMGHLDWETLCTARLVSKTFCAAASVHVHSLTLASTSKAVSFCRYPHVGHVTVTHAYPDPPNEEASLAQLDPRLWDRATALKISNNTDSTTATRDYLSQAALMPKLRKLTVTAAVDCEAALLARCTNLEAISFTRCSMSVARSIVTMTQLTAIQIDSLFEDGKGRTSADVSWLEHATKLRRLRALSISISGEALPLIGNLTGLTGLTVADRVAEGCSIAPLTRLNRLRSLRIGFAHSTAESNIGIASSLGSGSLVNLELQLCCSEALAHSGKFLSRQTGLTRLHLGGRPCNLRHIGALRIELLQCLQVDVETLDAPGLSVLRRATSLTQLIFSTGCTQPQMGLTQALGRLTQLRSLSLGSWEDEPRKLVDFPLALSRLTGLTELIIADQDLDDEGLRALLGLTGLQVLELYYCGLTPEVVPQLGMLTRLSTLTVVEWHDISLAAVSEVLDPLRKARGLRPLHTRGWEG